MPCKVLNCTWGCDDSVRFLPQLGIVEGLCRSELEGYWGPCHTTLNSLGAKSNTPLTPDNATQRQIWRRQRLTRKPNTERKWKTSNPSPILYWTTLDETLYYTILEPLRTHI